MATYTENYHLRKDGLTERYSVNTQNSNMDTIDSVLGEHEGKIIGISSPFNFKGACTYANLPSSGMHVNDTWYVTDRSCNYTWNGTAWIQSSMPFEIDTSFTYAGKAADAKATGDAINAIDIEVDDDGEGNVTLNIVKQEAT